jgi:hypothetical protein
MKSKEMVDDFLMTFVKYADIDNFINL